MKKSKDKNKPTDETMDSFDLAQKYGTYEIQDTADTDNKFPEISQGLAKKVNSPKNRRLK